MKIGVVGAGAVGAYYGSLLARAGSEVVFLVRSDWEAVSRRGYWIQEQGKEPFQLYPVRAFRRTEEMGPCDLILIAVKATAREALRELLPPLLQPQTVLVALQNGLGNEEWLSDVFPDQPVIGGIVFGCLTRTAPGRVENAGFGKIELGAYVGARGSFLREVALRFERAGVPCSVVESLEAARWRKLAWNIPFNGISVAGGGCDVEEILRDAELSRLATGLMEEVAAVARGRALPFPEDWTKRMIADTMRMGPYRPSTLVDFLAGRSIEVEAIWGEPLRRAQQLGVPTPRLQALYALLRALDRRSGQALPTGD